MRNAIRDQILAHVTGITDVYEAHMADAKTKKPYVVVRAGAESDEGEWAGFRRTIEIWPYVSKTTYNEVDRIAKEVIAALEWKPLTDEDGQVFTCVYAGSATEDVVDNEWDAITKGFQFHVIAISPVDHGGVIASDPWLTALAEWTKTILGPTYNVYTGSLPVGYQRPAVLWRITNINMTGVSRSLFDIRKSFVGHVFDVNPTQQAATSLTLVTELMDAIKIPLDIANSRYMTVDEPRANMEADGISQGQITLTLYRKTSRPKEDVPFINYTEGNGTFGGIRARA